MIFQFLKIKFFCKTINKKVEVESFLQFVCFAPRLALICSCLCWLQQVIMLVSNFHSIFYFKLNAQSQTKNHNTWFHKLKILKHI